jgi:hypothetical protein
MVLCEDYRAFGSCLLSPEIKGLIHDEASRLLNAEGLLDRSYSDMMRSTLEAMFPPEVSVETHPVPPLKGSLCLSCNRPLVSKQQT